MKRLIVLFLTGTFLVSCGRDKKNDVQANVVAKSDKYSLVIDAIYEKDDSIAVIHQVNNYFIYDKPTTLLVKGSPQIQRITVNIPEGVAAENFTFVTSTNKEQKYLTIKNISVKNNDSLLLDGSNNKFFDYFMADKSFTWDPKLMRNNLNHNNEYPPAFVGSEKLVAHLAK